MNAVGRAGMEEASEAGAHLHRVLLEIRLEVVEVLLQPRHVCAEDGIVNARPLVSDLAQTRCILVGALVEAGLLQVLPFGRLDLVAALDVLEVACLQMHGRKTSKCTTTWCDGRCGGPRFW